MGHVLAQLVDDLVIGERGNQLVGGELAFLCQLAQSSNWNVQAPGQDSQELRRSLIYRIEFFAAQNARAKRLRQLQHGRCRFSRPCAGSCQRQIDGLRDFSDLGLRDAQVSRTGDDARVEHAGCAHVVLRRSRYALYILHGPRILFLRVRAELELRRELGVLVGQSSNLGQAHAANQSGTDAGQRRPGSIGSALHAGGCVAHDLTPGIHVPLEAGDAGHQLNLKTSDDHWLPQLKKPA